MQQLITIHNAARRGPNSSVKGQVKFYAEAAENDTIWWWRRSRRTLSAWWCIVLHLPVMQLKLFVACEGYVDTTTES